MLLGGRSQLVGRRAGVAARGLFFRAPGPPRGRVCAVAALFLLLQPSHLFVGALGRVAPCSMLPFLHAILRRLYLRLTCSLPTCWKGTCANQTLPPAMYDCGGNAMLGSIVRDRASSIEQTDTVHTTCATSVDTRLVLTP
jgi:hypothetical protein